MPYATIAQLEDERIARASLEQAADATAGSADYDARVNAALEWASAQIDSYAVGRYAVPLQPSVTVRGLAMDMAVYRLQMRHSVIRDNDKAGYENALKFLRDLSAGKVSLDQPAGEDAQTVTGGAVATEIPLVFSDDNLSDF